MYPTYGFYQWSTQPFSYLGMVTIRFWFFFFWHKILIIILLGWMHHFILASFLLWLVYLFNLNISFALVVLFKIIQFLPLQKIIVHMWNNFLSCFIYFSIKLQILRTLSPKIKELARKKLASIYLCSIKKIVEVLKVNAIYSKFKYMYE